MVYSTSTSVVFLNIETFWKYCNALQCAGWIGRASNTTKNPICKMPSLECKVRIDLASKDLLQLLWNASTAPTVGQDRRLHNKRWGKDVCLLNVIIIVTVIVITIVTVTKFIMVKLSSIVIIIVGFLPKNANIWPKMPISGQICRNHFFGVQLQLPSRIWHHHHPVPAGVWVSAA